MKVVLLRVGIDTGCGGILGPLFQDSTFELIPIPDSRGLDERTYGNTKGRKHRLFIDYFPERMRARMSGCPMHVDPEFETFTYGDPTPPKRALARLTPGDLLVFYAGLQGFGCKVLPGLYLVGYFEVQLAGFAPEFSDRQLRTEFAANFHVRHPRLLASQRDELVLIKGGGGSRRFRRAYKLGGSVKREDGSSWQIISPQMAKLFGHFGGIGSIQRSTPRWVQPVFVYKAAEFVRSLE